MKAGIIILLNIIEQGEFLIHEEDAIQTIDSEGDSVAILLLPGIQYYTGQLFNIPKLTAIAHKKGIIVGCDLAHAAGNVSLNLHDWKVDFAAWCTYKVNYTYHPEPSNN